jgi:hypothetical protein
MRKTTLLLAACLLAAASPSLAEGTNANSATKVYLQDGGNTLTVDSGGLIEVLSGGELEVESGGSLTVAGATVSTTELLYLDGLTAGTVTASKACVVDSNKDIGDFRNLDVTNLDAGASATAGSVDIFPTTASSGKLTISAADNAGNTTTTLTNRSQAGARTYTIGDAGASADFVLARGATVSGVGAAKGLDVLLVEKTAIADNTATSVITVTVPNANHAAAIRLTLLATMSTGTDAFESSRVATGTIVLSRTTGANVVAAASTIAQAQIATVSGGGTITLAYGVSSVTGAVGATNTFDVQVTIVVTGTITDHRAIVLAELINSQATGVTMAASP